MSTLLSTHSLSYDTNLSQLLKNITLNIQSGDRIGLIGHNGSGKSTLLKILSEQLQPNTGTVTKARNTLLAYIEQQIPCDVTPLSLLDAILERLPLENRISESWRAELLLAQMGFQPTDWILTTEQLSGGQHTRLLLARALITNPDLLLLDEPSNHLDLPTLLWLEQFLLSWRGSFILVSHDQMLLDKTTNCTWILRDGDLLIFRLSCTQARLALSEQDASDEQRKFAEQKEIDRITQSAKRLAMWGHVYDNEGLSRKAKQMEKHIVRLQDDQTIVAKGSPWKLQLQGEAIQANRLTVIEQLHVKPQNEANTLYFIDSLQIKSGDRIAIMGANGTGKTSLLRMLWSQYQQSMITISSDIVFHPRMKMGYYDQHLHQIENDNTLIEALTKLAPQSNEYLKMALIYAGFTYQRHQQKVATLSGGERSRLLFVGLSLAQYSQLLLDEPTNHLDLEGKEALSEQIAQFTGAILLVSHDRQLIENSCNRFWFIHKNRLEEHHDIETIYQMLSLSHTDEILINDANIINHNNDNHVGIQYDIHSEDNHEDILLARLFELEEKLSVDLQRKSTHQKPMLQKQWQAEIIKLKQQLFID